MKKLFLSVISIFLFLGLIAQNNILLTIDDEKISSEEFERIYQKNKKNFSTGDVISVDEYLDLFVNFKLKVAEAESRGLDTLTSFKREFEGYRKQLIKPYFVDKECKNKLINTAYNRLQYEIRVKHILLKLSPNASAEDTAFVYNKALEIRNRIIKGEKFELVAKGTSDDPSVRNNGGDIGYFTAFQMVYSFEDVAYKLDIGKISYPVRTKFGYHIIQKVDKREAKGQAKVAHIMLTVPRGMQPSKTIEKEKLINEIYHKLKEGEKFADLVKIYSEDRGSAKNGGKLPWFGSGRMVKPFEDAAFELANIGDISKPIRTSFGWHIVKLLDKKEIGSFDDMKPEIEKSLERDSRIKIAQDKFIENLKIEYNVLEDTNSYNKLCESIREANNGLYKIDNFNDTLFVVNKRKYTINNFIKYLKDNNKYKQINTLILEKEYNIYLNDIIIALEDNNLEDKYPELKYLLKEYHDGILLFDLTDKLIWTKAAKDSTGLKKYFKNNRNKYMWDERYKGVVYLSSNSNVFNKAKELTKKRFLRKTLSPNEILEKFNTEKQQVRIEKGIFSKGENEIVDSQIFNIKNVNSSQNKYVFLRGNIIHPTKKKFAETKGSVISDYQEHLEKMWIKELREKYNIIVNNEVLDKVKIKLEK